MADEEKIAQDGCTEAQLERRIDMVALANNVAVMADRTGRMETNLGKVWDGVRRINGTLGQHGERIMALETCQEAQEKNIEKQERWQENMKLVVAVAAGLGFFAGAIVTYIIKFLV